MPLHILLILVVGGIGGIVLALHLLGLSRTEPLTEARAREAWLRHWPEDEVRALHLTADGRAARVDTDRGRGLVWQIGADTCARRLTGAETVRFDGDRADIALGDYTAPRVRLTLTPGERGDFENWMRPA